MTATVTRDTYVAYIYPGVVVGEESTKKITMREINRTTREAPEGAIGFYYYDEFVTVMEVGVGKVPIMLKSARMELSPTYFIDAEVVDADAVQELNNPTLTANMVNASVLILHRHGGYHAIRDVRYRLVNSR